MSLHLIKLCVGVRDVAHLAVLQHQRVGRDPPLRHLTRSTPRRAGEILDGGSLYWVIGGILSVRQRVTDITEDRVADGTRYAVLVLDPVLVPVEGRRTKPFQGWRYLSAADAPPDIVAGFEPDGMPAALRQQLRDLALL